MKKRLLILIFLGLTLPLLVPAVTIEITPPVKATSFGELVDGFLTFLWWLSLALFPLMIVIAGFYFITAAGNPAQIEKAKGIILYSVIGLLVIIVAKALIDFFLKLI